MGPWTEALCCAEQDLYINLFSQTSSPFVKEWRWLSRCYGRGHKFTVSANNQTKLSFARNALINGFFGRNAMNRSANRCSKSMAAESDSADQKQNECPTCHGSGLTPELSRPAAGHRLGASVAEKHPGGAPMRVRLERIVRPQRYHGSSAQLFPFRSR